MDIHRLLAPTGDTATDSDDVSSPTGKRQKSSPRSTTSQQQRHNSQQTRSTAQRVTGGPITNGDALSDETSKQIASKRHDAITSPTITRAQKEFLSPYRPSLAHRCSSKHELQPGTAIPSSDLGRRLSSRSLATVTMDEGPTQMPTPREFDSDEFSEEELRTITNLLTYLKDHQYAYESHVQLINLLHSGLIKSRQSEGPHGSASYNMLPELRQAREAMDSRFAIGENLWLDWLHDEMLLAKSAEERVDVVQYFQKAVQDEPASTKIWQAYLDWLQSNYDICRNRAEETTAQTGLSEEDAVICRAVFTKDMILETLELASAAVRWRIDTGHEIWNRYLEFLHQNSIPSDSATDDKLSKQVTMQEVEQIFLSRLQEPHTNMDETLQLFWPILNHLYAEHWEEAMSSVQETMATARVQAKDRENHEQKLDAALQSGDHQAIIEAYTRYLRWEPKPKHRSTHDKDIRSALYERALLTCPTSVDWWLEYIDFITSQEPSSHNPSRSLLPLLERATKHCPWSGELWARRILRSDYERQSYDEIEATKHRATNSGLLDVGGMEELLKVLIEWCSYLRRQAFSATATEDNKDLTEVGITMALEDMQQAGTRLYGESFEGDPLYRLEQIQIKFLSEARRMDDARAIWRSLIPTKQNSHDFWQRYCVWEITLWIHDRVNDRERIETTETGPQLATAIVEEALRQTNLDYPEKVADMYINHFLHNESVEKLQAASVAVSQFRRKIALKRAKEAEVLAQEQEQYYQQKVEDETLKRKREEDAGEDELDHKKAKTAEAEVSQDNTSTQPQKRNREHLTLTLTNLAPSTTDKDIRSFLHGCGDILSVDIAPTDGGTTSAAVEFADSEDMEFAKSRSGRSLNGREVHIQSGKQSTLYVTNYPPEYDEAAIRKLFSTFGDITSVRFPTLKFNNRRRFCYVQFASHQQAKATETAMDGKKLDGLHTLVAKISNPNAKKDRGGAQAEGRELFVKNIDNSVSEEDVKAYFERFGSVQSINLLKNRGNKRLGEGFVVYAQAGEAQKAIEQADNKPLGERILHVTLSTQKGATVQASKQNIIVKHGENGETASNGRRGSDVSMVSSQSHDAESHKTVRERRVALFNVPSTVTDARITTEMEKHGPVTMLQLRRAQDAAIVEFEDVKTAFNVRVGIEFPALGPQCKSGDVQDLQNIGGNAAAKHKPAMIKSATAAFRPAAVSRPAQRGARRGGLGFKRGGFGSSASTTTTGSVAKTNGDSGAAKSNADFKAIFAQRGPAQEPADTEE